MAVRFLLAIVFMILSIPCFGQVSEVLSEITDDFFEETSDDGNIEMQDNLDELYLLADDSLLNINNISYAELQMLGFLNNTEINGILNYREKYGDFCTLTEIKGAGVLDKNIDNMYAIFFSEYENTPRFKPKNALRNANNRLSMFFKRNNSTQSNSYAGSPWNMALRYRFSSNNIKFGFIGEKDAGEKFTFNSQTHGFDFNSAYLCVTGLKGIESLIIGDYKLKIGQGLIHSNGYTMGKTSLVNDICKEQDVVLPNTSAAENDFLRGVAIKTKLGKFRLMGFASNKNFDATTKNDSTFSSYKTDGYHRTESELTSKRSINEKLIGVQCGVRLPTFYVAYTFLTCQYSKSYTPAATLANEKIPIFDSYNAQSLNYQILAGRLTAFGEMSMVGKVAVLNGITYQAAPTVVVSALQRYFPPEYFSHYASAFSERTSVSNEDAFYLGISFHGLKNTEIKTYFDFFKHPWCTYYVSSQHTNGSDMLTYINYKFNKTTHLYFKWRGRQRPKNITATQNNSISYAHTHTDLFRLRFKFMPTTYLTSETSVGFVFYSFNHSYENGHAICQNLRLSHPSGKSFLEFRTAIFNTTYNTRIYASETSVSYNYSSPCLYGNGQRLSMCAQTIIAKKLSLQIHLSHIDYANDDKKDIGELVFCIGYKF